MRRGSTGVATTLVGRRQHYHNNRRAFYSLKVASRIVASPAFDGKLWVWSWPPLESLRPGYLGPHTKGRTFQLCAERSEP